MHHTHIKPLITLFKAEKRTSDRIDELQDKLRDLELSGKPTGRTINQINTWNLNNEVAFHHIAEYITTNDLPSDLPDNLDFGNLTTYIYETYADMYEAAMDEL